MTVFIRNKSTGNVSRYPLTGNVSIEDGNITIAKDPRIGSTIWSFPLEDYEIVRVTERELETPEAVTAWTDRKYIADRYIKEVFGRETR